MWDVASRRTVALLQGHTAWVFSVAFSPDGKLRASGSDGDTIKLWDVAAAMKAGAGLHQRRPAAQGEVTGGMGP
jgi:WD40 repeat protein